MKQISIAIPTWERTDLLYNSFSKVINDDRVGEIVIVDDCSSMAVYEEIKNTLKNESKVKLYRNEVNFDCYKNKRESVSKASNPYVILLDSDNELNTDYLDKIFAEEWDEETILQPSWAKPTFNFEAFENLVITEFNVNEYLDKPMFLTMLNAMNFFVNRDKYLQVWDDSVNPHTADSIYFNYCWLAHRYKIKVVEGLHYQHRVHTGSHYVNNNHKTGNFYNEVIERIKQLG